MPPAPSAEETPRKCSCIDLENTPKENIPKTLEEAHLQLEQKLPKEELAKIDAMKSEEETDAYHFGLGLEMRNGWRLWSGSPLKTYMKNLGFIHPDDMSGVILRTLWCKRHNQDFRIEERVAYYKAYWKATARPPATLKDPKDQSDVDWTIRFHVGDENTPRVIHVGKSKKTGRWLAYEYDKGVYEPDEMLMKKINDSRK